AAGVRIPFPQAVAVTLCLLGRTERRPVGDHLQTVPLRDFVAQAQRLGKKEPGVEKEDRDLRCDPARHVEQHHAAGSAEAARERRLVPEMFDRLRQNLLGGLRAGRPAARHDTATAFAACCGRYPVSSRPAKIACRLSSGLWREVSTTISGRSGGSYGSEIPVNCWISPAKAFL